MASLIGEVPNEYDLLDTNQLLQRVIREKDKMAWGVLAKKEEQRLLNYARYRFQNVDQADLEDLVQTVFVKIYEKGLGYRGSSPGEAFNYLKKMVFHQIVTFCNRMKRIVHVEGREDDEQDYEVLIEQDASRHDKVANSRLEQIENDDNSDATFFLNNGDKPYSLTLQERRVVRLLCKGLNHKEIAGRLHCTEARITAIVKKIREKFAIYLAQGE